MIIDFAETAGVAGAAMGEYVSAIVDRVAPLVDGRTARALRKRCGSFTYE
jgi:hypothetical protein